MSADVWDPGHPVLRLLHERKRTGSKPLNRADGARLGLAVEGGGMRGVVSASMLVALEDLGFTETFDVVYGASSGAINAAYFLLGEGAWYPASIYHDDLTTRRFLNMRNLFIGKAPLDLEYAFGIVVDKLKPLDYEGVINSKIPLRIAITLVDECRTLVTGDIHSPEELKAALLASAWLPIGARGTASYQGRRAVDGGVLTALPFRLALDDGCTHVLSLSTRPMPSRRRHPSVLHKYTARYLDRLQAGLGPGYIGAVNTKHGDEMWLRQMRVTPPTDAPYVLDLAPLPEDTEVKRHELRREHLMAAARRAYELAFAALGGRSASAIRAGEIRAVPRLTIAERCHDEPYIRLIDHDPERPVRWGRKLP